MKRVAHFMLVSIALAACSRSSEKVNLGYFSISHYVDSLCAKFPVVTVNKSIEVDGKTEIKVVTDSLKHLIGFLKEFELNKPVNKNSYTVSLTKDTTTAYNRSSIIYTLKDELKQPIKRFVVITGDGAEGNNTIAFTLQQGSLLSDVHKTLEMSFNTSTGLRHCVYSVEENIKYASDTKLRIKLTPKN